MSTMVVTEDLRKGRAVGMFLLAVLVFVGSLVLVQGWKAGIVAGITVAILWRGVTGVRAGEDQTIRYRVWEHPAWMRWGATGAFVLAFILAVVRPDRNIFSGVYLLAAAACAVSAVIAGAWVPAWKRQQEAAPTSAEDAAAARVSTAILGQVGLTWKSPKTGLDVYPELHGVGRDERDRVFFDASVIAGRQTVEDFQKAGARIASAWGVPRVVVTEPAPHVARVTAILHETRLNGPVQWYMAPDAEVAEYVQRLPMGAEVETGDEWVLNLAERNFVIGGIPGSGKSSFANALLAHLARHPDVRIGFIDLKFGAEAAPWEPRADAVISNTPDDPEAGTMDALAFISEAVADLGARYKRMIEAGVQNAWTEGFLGPDEPVKVLVIDECSELFKADTPERAKLANRVIAQLKSFVQQGRAAGYVLLMSTQYPKDENLPTSIRENASDKIAFHVGSEKGMHAILGYSYVPESKADDPTRITVEERGQAVVVGDTGEAARIQMSWISKETKAAVVESSAQLRRSWLDKGQPEPEERREYDPAAEEANMLPDERERVQEARAAGFPDPITVPRREDGTENLAAMWEKYPDARPEDEPIDLPDVEESDPGNRPVASGEPVEDDDGAEEVPEESGPWRI